MGKFGKSAKSSEKKNKNDIIASRKSCAADGTGLSHYVLIDKKAK
ncbi:MAG: modified peptide precursor CbpA [Candidatus Omnitrophota bacterium]|jgi:modified peptide precursor CbpA